MTGAEPVHGLDTHDVDNVCHPCSALLPLLRLSAYKWTKVVLDLDRRNVEVVLYLEVNLLLTWKSDPADDVHECFQLTELFPTNVDDALSAYDYRLDACSFWHYCSDRLLLSLVVL